jgi:hypothetical protein
MHSFWLNGARSDNPEEMQNEAASRMNVGKVLVFTCRRCKASFPVRNVEHARQTANALARFARVREENRGDLTIDRPARLSA